MSDSMSYTEIFLLAIGLCFDTFAVSLVGGACKNCLSVFVKIKIIISFALFQAGFTVVGWALGSTVSSYIENYDHWIAFALLLYIGGKMLIDSFSTSEEKSVDLLTTSKLVVASVATSIDALAVGISFAFLHMSCDKVLWSGVIVFVVTAVAALSGLLSGNIIGKKIGRKANLAGGLILILIGIKILIEHL
jgi:manganese efflux pump family protein